MSWPEIVAALWVTDVSPRHPIMSVTHSAVGKFLQKLKTGNGRSLENRSRKPGGYVQGLSVLLSLSPNLFTK